MKDVDSKDLNEAGIADLLDLLDDLPWEDVSWDDDQKSIFEVRFNPNGWKVKVLDHHV